MIVGMDFGTTNSGMAVYDGERLRHVPLDPMNATPHVARSALYITNDRSVYIGRDAVETYYQQNLDRPSKYEHVPVGEIELTFAELPTFIRTVYIEKDIYSPGRLFLSFKSGLSSTNYLGTIVGSHYYFLEDIIAVYLYLAKKRAEAYLQIELDTIVLGRPVRFSDDPTHNDLARERLLQAAFRAGYKTVYLQYEPIAAAYYYEASIDREQNVLIFDFGGGTLDISILRLGNPKTREVLATGGIPIAGDVFDRKIVRATLPPHFGAGSTYRDTNQDLPVPSSYYAAFSDWQELLLLQRAERLERLRRIERTARNPLKIRALINLITSHYGLKMFDVAEAGKRRLSEETQTLLKFDGPGFSVRERLTRIEFEQLIRSDMRAISRRLDEVVESAGLSRDQIDAVIRTGGSSRITAFIEMLEERFGVDKVRDIDAFSSVTSGLGIIARQIETGELPLKAHTPETQSGGEYLNAKTQGGIPVIDLGVMKKLIDLKEDQPENDEESVVLVGESPDGRLAAVEHPLAQLDANRSLKQLGLPDDVQPPVDAIPPDERVVLMTTDYRLLCRSARELADLRASGLNLEKLEGFHSDAFGKETVCALARWSCLEGAEFIAMLSTRGYARRLIGEQFLSKLTQPIPYQMEKSLGVPAALLRVETAGDLVAISHAGRAVRMRVSKLSTLEERLIQLPRESTIAGTFYVEQPREIIIATASGYAKRVFSSAIPSTTAFNTTGEKIITRTQPVDARLFQPDRQLWAVTTRRIVPIDQHAVPLLDPDTTTSHKLLRLKRGERLVSLFYAGH